jgi:hypothetical protein
MTARPGMIGMRMGNDGTFYQPPGINIKVSSAAE